MEPGTQVVWTNRAGKRFLKFVFNGHFSEEQAIPAIASWKKEFSQNMSPGQKTNIIWDCLNMTGFDPKVKSKWQEVLKEQSGYIDDIWIISKNPIIRLAATTMGMLTKYRIKAVNSESDIS